jgi:hypothetical protein
MWESLCSERRCNSLRFFSKLLLRLSLILDSYSLQIAASCFSFLELSDCFCPPLCNSCSKRLISGMTITKLHTIRCDQAH